eukprot:3425655-Lingulodinium_polyedra.AAC.1
MHRLCGSGSLAKLVAAAIGAVVRLFSAANRAKVAFVCTNASRRSGAHRRGCSNPPGAAVPAAGTEAAPPLPKRRPAFWVWPHREAAEAHGADQTQWSSLISTW